MQLNNGVSAIELYRQIDAVLTPLLRKNLNYYLPIIGGSNWWEQCVLPALSPVQLDNLKREETLDQFDYPALVSIFYRNWRSIRPQMNVGNELTNYLFTIKTFRNDAMHQTNLVIDSERKSVLWKSCELASKLLTLDETSEDVPRYNTAFKFVKVNAIKIGTLLLTFILLLMIYMSTNSHEKTKENTEELSFLVTKGNPTEIELVCAKLSHLLEVARQYDNLTDINHLYKDELMEYSQKCLELNDLSRIQISLEDRILIQNRVDREVKNAIMSGKVDVFASEPELILSLAYSVFVKHNIFPEGKYVENYQVLITEIKKWQKRYRMEQTGIPTVDLLFRIDSDLKGI